MSESSAEHGENTPKIVDGPPVYARDFDGMAERKSWLDPDDLTALEWIMDHLRDGEEILIEPTEWHDTRDWVDVYYIEGDGKGQSFNDGGFAQGDFVGWLYGRFEPGEKTSRVVLAVDILRRGDTVRVRNADFPMSQAQLEDTPL